MSDAIALGIAIAFVVIPGLTIGMIAGFRGLPLLALAGPFSIAIVAGTAVAVELVGIDFGPIPVVAATGVIAAGLLLLRAPLRRAQPLTLGRWDRATAIGAVAALLGGAAISAVYLIGVSGMDAISGTYDGVFHLNAAASVLQTGAGSSLSLYRITHPGPGFEFYPAAWHDLVALTARASDVGIPVATSAVWLAVSAVVWPLGLVWLADAVFGAGRPRALLLAAAGLLSAASTAHPHLLATWGTLYPTGLAYSLLPSGMALAVVLVRRGAPRPTRLLIVAACALWALGLVFSHPRSTPSFVVLVIPLILPLLISLLISGLRDPSRRKVYATVLIVAVATTVAAGAIAARWVFTTYGLADRPLSDRLNGGPATAREDLLSALLRGLGAVGLDPTTGIPLTASFALTALSLAGAVVALRTRQGRWLMISALLVIVLFTAAAGSNSDVAKLLTAIWYKDQYRLIALLPMTLVPLAAVATAALAERILRAGSSSDRKRSGLAVGTAAVIAAAVIIGTVPSLTSVSGSLERSFAVPDGKKQGALLDADEERLLEELPEVLPEDAVVVGDPWNGSGLSWALGERRSLFPHMSGVWDPDRVVVATRLDMIATDPEVCAALDRLGARYLIVSEGRLWNGDPQAAFFDGIARTDPDALGAEMLRYGDSALYSIDVCG